MSLEDEKDLLLLKNFIGELTSPQINHKLRYEWDKKKGVILIKFKSKEDDARKYIGLDNLANLCLLEVAFINFSQSLIGASFGASFGGVKWKTIFPESGGKKFPTKDMYFVVSDSILDLLSDVQNVILAGDYEKAARFYQFFRCFKKAGELRRKERTRYEISLKIGEDGTIKIQCPHCGASQPTELKSNEVTCKYCGKTYIIPKKIFDMV